MKYSKWKYKVLIDPIMQRLSALTGFRIPLGEIPERIARENKNPDFPCLEYRDPHKFADDIEHSRSIRSENDEWIILCGDIIAPDAETPVDFSVDRNQLVLRFCEERKELSAYFFHRIELEESEYEEDY